MHGTFKEKLWTAALLAGGVALGMFLFFFNPERHPFYPRCLLYALTGLQCPGCGGLRAAHHLLHGQLILALQLNPLLPLFLLVFGFLAISWLYRVITGRPLWNPLRHPAWIWLLLGLFLAFAIARNLLPQISGYFHSIPYE